MIREAIRSWLGLEELDKVKGKLTELEGKVNVALQSKVEGKTFDLEMSKLQVAIDLFKTEFISFKSHKIMTSSQLIEEAILNAIKDNTRMRATDLIKVTGNSKPTILTYLKRLVQEGRLVAARRMENGLVGTWYELNVEIKKSEDAAVFETKEVPK